MKIKDYKAEARKLLLGNYGILIASQFIIYMLTYGMTFAAALMVGGSTALAISGNVAATSAAAVITAAVIAAVLIGMLFLSLGIIKQYLNLCRSTDNTIKAILSAKYYKWSEEQIRREMN